jgi:hypothetical protein
MHRRAAQLACLLLLLSSFGVAEAPARSTCLSLGGHYLRTLSQQNYRAADEPGALALSFHRSVGHAQQPVAGTQPAVAMRPPNAHAIAVQASTASGL